MKILHVNDYYQHLGGAEKLFLNTLSALEERGVENVVLHEFPAESKPERRSFEIPGLGKIGSAANSEAIERYEEILRKEKPDLIHLYDIVNSEVQAVSLRFRPAVQSVFDHSFYCPGGNKYLPLLKRQCHRSFGPGCLASEFLTHCGSIRPRVMLNTYRRTYGMMKKTRGLFFLTLSKYQSQCLSQNGISSDRIECLPPFSDVPESADQKADTSEEQQILFTGRIMPYKGLELLLQAMPYIRSRCVLIVDGDGQGLEKARETAHKLKILDRVRFKGWLPPQEHWKNFRRANVVAVPSIWPEPFGLVGIEAMNYGKPVVAFNVGGIPDWLEDGVTGFLIPPLDVKTMALKLDALLANPSLAQQMGKQGRINIQKKFSKKNYVDALLKIYQKLSGIKR